MKEILLTSSALILALLALRRLFRKTLSRRAQYALWGLVLLRLLVPVSLPAAEFSLLTAAEPARQAVETRLETPQRYFSPMSTVPASQFPAAKGAKPGHAIPDYEGSFDYPVLSEDGNTVTTYAVRLETPFIWKDVLTAVWGLGAGVMAAWLVFSNLRFWRKLREYRIPYAAEGAEYPVYLVESGLPSPCLFGLFRPAIYLTPAALQSPDSLRHVLAHEETHARHRDPLWSLLRGVCLTVYWFDPLVWWAALASRTDCELACDEGALRRLGEAERVPYGRTLLSLIPVRKAPANPLLSATTMTAGKRQLKDRITRVAENPAYLGRALFAAVALAALVCAVTFTGAKTPAPEPARFHDVDEAVSTLAEELENYGGPEGGIMSKLVVYTPENPPEHFDLEDGELLRVYWGVLWTASSNLSDPMGWLCSLYRLDLEPDYLPRNMEILGSDGQYQYGISCPDWAPEMKQGETTGMSLMNQVAERIRKVVLPCLTTLDQPDWEPIITIPLDGLEPYEPQEAEALPFPYGSPKMLGGLEDPDHVLGDYGLMFFEGGDSATGGEVFAGVQHWARSSWPTPFWSFRPGAGRNYSASLFRNLLGHDGFCITYNANDREWPLTNEYYYLNEEGWPVLLARMEDYSQRMDLDGDGVDELVSNDMYADHFYFRRDGKHYKADLRPLLWTVWPMGTYLCFDGWDPASRSMPFRAQVSSDPSYQYRTLYFDGESLLVYNDQRHFTDHMVEWFDEEFTVKDAALTAVEERFHASRLDGAFCDDWRITSIGESHGLEVDGKFYVFRQVSYEFHTPELQDAPALGEGIQDYWAAPSSENLYLLFLVPSWNSSDEISYADFVYLYSFQQEGSLVLSEELVREKLREMPPSDTIYLGAATLQAETSIVSAANLAQAVMDRLLEADTVNMNLLTSRGGGRYDVDPQAGNGPSQARGFTSHYDWSYAEDTGDMPAESLLLMSPGGDLSLRFWPESELVLLHTYRESTWLRAEPKDDPGGHPYENIFNYMRSWYDEAELAGLSPTIRVTSRNLSREQVVRLWADLYEGTKRKVSPGSKYACTYVQIEDISFSDWLDELTEEELDSLYPEATRGHERFAFSYTTVFVPENDRALNGIMLGDTAPYESPDALEGARTYNHCGYMYLTEEGWRCDGVGTGW